MKIYSSIGKCLAIAGVAYIGAQSSWATENFELRTIPGYAGSDMTVPLDPGFYIQLPTYSYSGRIDLPTKRVSLSSQDIFTGASSGLASAFPDGQTSTDLSTKVRFKVQAIAPRFTFMTGNRFLGASVGGTAMIKFVSKSADVSVVAQSTSSTGIDDGTLQALTSGALNLTQLTQGVRQQVQSASDVVAHGQSGKTFGLGDIELGPLLRWFSDPDQIVFAATLVLPTGSYDSARATNPSEGNFYTFRPTIQYGHIGDGWDFGIRSSLSVNTINKDTQYKSGNYVNVDASVMRSFGDALRLGLNFYGVWQTTKDTTKRTIDSSDRPVTLGHQGRILGAGPSVAWIKGAEDYLVELRATKEFGAQVRPSGASTWLILSMPLK